MAKRALYVATHAWTSPIRVGSQAIAAQFVQKGWEVAYIAAPITPLHFLRPFNPQFAVRLRENRLGGRRDMHGHLWHYVPFSWLAPSNRPFLRSEWLFHGWRYLTSPDLLSIVRREGFADVDLLIMDTIFQPFWLDAVNYGRCVMRLSDYNAGFSGYGGGAEASEQLLLERADIVITASAGLWEWALKKGAREALYIPNGIDFERFSDMHPIRPVEYESLKGSIAVFVGVIDEWVDLLLIETCARALPEVSFVLIGPCQKNILHKNFPANVHFLGMKAQADIPAYLYHANAGLIPFRSERRSSLIEHINPLKLYEYLAAGLPVVSTRWRELENLHSPARLCSSDEDFLVALKSVLAEPGNANEYRRYAKSVDWAVRLLPLFDWINRK